ncbi:MAG TPA: hypothetical protein VG223_01245 [Solirubrobacteraceae bacterium]|jgi:hypothetical protein|nr:hypothetical protein [Solirubrobacteraceae bacterium]
MSAPPVTTSKVDTVVFLIFFGALALAAIGAAVRIGWRRRDVAPVAVCLGALVCALNEPIFDELGKIVYAHNATVAYTAFGREIPLFLVLGYVPWVAGLSWAIAELMARGCSRTRLHWIALGSFVSVAAVETAGTSLHSWTYYGTAPLKYLGVAPMMAPVPIVCGALIYTLGTRLRGAHRAWIALAPLFALPAVYAAAGMPIYVALHSHTAKSVQYLAGVATIAFCAAIVYAGTAVAEWWRAAELAADPIAPSRDTAPSFEPERVGVTALVKQAR